MFTYKKILIELYIFEKKIIMSVNKSRSNCEIISIVFLLNE